MRKSPGLRSPHCHPSHSDRGDGDISAGACLGLLTTSCYLVVATIQLLRLCLDHPALKDSHCHMKYSKSLYVCLLVFIITNITLQLGLWYRGGGPLRSDWGMGQKCTRECSEHCGQIQSVWPGGVPALLEPETMGPRLLQLYQ